MSDLISRKTVLEEIQKIECEPGYQHVGEDWAVGLIIAENIVESAESIESKPSAEPERRWIPVIERLPEDSETVLITHKGGVSFGYYNGIYWERGSSTKHKPLQTVIAWMPLPEPYRGD